MNNKIKQGLKNNKKSENHENFEIFFAIKHK